MAPTVFQDNSYFFRNEKLLVNNIYPVNIIKEYLLNRGSYYEPAAIVLWTPCSHSV